jgi:hypothetical protein
MLAGEIDNLGIAGRSRHSGCSVVVASVIGGFTSISRRYQTADRFPKGGTP